MRLSSLEGTKLETRLPSKKSLAAVSEFARKTGDYPQLSGVDLQILALLYEMEVEAAGIFGNSIEHVRREPKRVLGVSVKALTGDGKRVVKGRVRGDSMASESNASCSGMLSNSLSVNSFFEGNADGIIDAGQVDIEYDDDDEFEDETKENSVVTESAGSATTGSGSQPKVSSWAKLVNPTVASSGPLLNYSLATSAKDSNVVTERLEEPADIIIRDTLNHTEDAGQFDDASESSADSHAGEGDVESDDEAKAIQIANADSDEEMSDEECDVFILEPHEVVYYKKLKEQKMLHEKGQSDDLADRLNEQEISSVAEANDEGGLDCEFPSLAAAAAVPYDGSDEELEHDSSVPTDDAMLWQQEEEERKKKSLQPMINGRVQTTTPKYNSFRKYGHVLSAEGAGASLKKAKDATKDEKSNDVSSTPMDETSDTVDPTSNQGYRSRIIEAGGAASALDAPNEMTADDDDGEGWVTCTRDIQTIKATGSLHLSQSSNPRNNKYANKPPKNPAPPISQRAACATTDFAMQNVILQMNLELLTIDGVRVRRLKTWVTRCAACFTIYGGNDDKKGKSGGRLFCDKCGSNTLQRIAASVDRNTGRLKLHMKKNYQCSTRGTKFSLPKSGKVSTSRLHIGLC